MIEKKKKKNEWIFSNPNCNLPIWENSFIHPAEDSVIKGYGCHA